MVQSDRAMKVLFLAAGRFDEALERQIAAGREPRLDVFERRTAALPVVSTRIGAIPEIVEDGSSGYLLEAGHGTRLAHVLELLAKDWARARKMRIPGREIVEQRLDGRRTTDLLLQQVRAAAREFIA